MYLYRIDPLCIHHWPDFCCWCCCRLIFSQCTIFFLHTKHAYTTTFFFQLSYSCNNSKNASTLCECVWVVFNHHNFIFNVNFLSQSLCSARMCAVCLLAFLHPNNFRCFPLLAVCSWADRFNMCVYVRDDFTASGIIKCTTLLCFRFLRRRLLHYFIYSLVKAHTNTNNISW